MLLFYFINKSVICILHKRDQKMIFFNEKLQIKWLGYRYFHIVQYTDLNIIPIFTQNRSSNAIIYL